MFGQEPFRVTPAGDPGDYVTYGFTMPRSTHQRKVSCREFECEAYANGWITTVPAGSAQAQYIETQCGRVFSREIVGTEARYTFKPEQSCFREHFVNLDRDPTYYRKGGDWRTGGRLHTLPGQKWLDDFQAQTEANRKIIEKG